MTSVSIALVRMLSVAVERAGATRQHFLDQASIDTGQLEELQGRIPIDDYRRAVRVAYELSGDPALGLHLGEQMSLGTFDVLGHLTEHSNSLREALAMTLRYVRIVTQGSPLQLVEHGEFATIRLDLPERDTLESRMTAEFSTTSMLRLVRRFIGADALPVRVFFPHPRPAYHAEYTRFFGGSERFSHEFTGLKLPRSWLDRAPHCHETELRSYLLARAEFLLARSSGQMSTAECVERWLEAQAELARPTLAKVARDLGVSTRSLRRRLLEEQVQFSALLDRARAAQAKHRLKDPRQQIQDTAYALGFRTASAFSRAFKRWTGMTPTAYRDAQVR
ncbi:MAG TPA: AraC family transcriptional regulator [Polyangiales bacterium]|nr:AraC family transcriptional regulator [Polyangiales bacterium]